MVHLSPPCRRGSVCGECDVVIRCVCVVDRHQRLCVACARLSSKRAKKFAAPAICFIHSLRVGWRNHGILKINLVIRLLDRKNRTSTSSMNYTIILVSHFILNRNTTIRVRAGTKNSRRVGFLL